MHMRQNISQRNALLNSKKKFSIGNIVALIMLKIMLKMIKKDMIPKRYMHFPAFIIVPKIQSQHIPKSDILLEKKKVVYRCGICNQKFVLKSDVNLTQNAYVEWVEGVKKHNCHVN